MKSTVHAPLLVASDSADNAQLIRKLLAEEFDNVWITTDEERAVADFERRKPQVLVLAFATLEQAQRYCLGLYRHGEAVHGTPHQSILLCNKDDVHRAYELCRSEYFDDYVLFWPMTQDAPRLRMAVHRALRQLGSGALAAHASELAAQARRIAELEAQLAKATARGIQHVEAASATLQAARREVGAALDGFSRRVADGELGGIVSVQDRRGFEDEVARLKSAGIDPPLASAATAVAPLQQWVESLRQELAPQLESARALRQLASQVRPFVLAVDDDPFQHRMLAQVFTGTEIDLACVLTGAEALGLMRRRRPDLVLMDIELPDIDGISITKRMRASPQLAAVPVMMITGHSEKHLIVDSLKAGAADIVVKPFDKATVMAKVSRLLRLREP
jgi:CheY-like chemotaxis protein